MQSIFNEDFSLLLNFGKSIRIPNFGTFRGERFDIRKAITTAVAKFLSESCLGCVMQTSFCRRTSSILLKLFDTHSYACKLALLVSWTEGHVYWLIALGSIRLQYTLYILIIRTTGRSVKKTCSSDLPERPIVLMVAKLKFNKTMLASVCQIKTLESQRSSQISIFFANSVRSLTVFICVTRSNCQTARLRDP